MERPLQNGLETAHRDLYRSIRKMQLTVWLALAYGTLGFLAAAYLYFKSSSKMTRSGMPSKENITITTNTSGIENSILWQGDYRKESQAVIREHVQTFMKYYFSYDSEIRKERQQRAVALLDPKDAKTLEKVYTDWHNQIENYGLVQDISDIEIEIIPSKEPWYFKATSQITLSGIGTAPTEYVLKCQGYMIQVPINEWNKNGLVITSFKSDIKNDKG